jgi:hypothetical protein
MEQELEEWFNRIGIATLPDEDVAELYEVISNSLAQAIEHLSGNSQQAGDPGSFSHRKVRILPKLLSRLSFRFSFDQLHQSFDLAKYNAPQNLDS